MLGINLTLNSIALASRTLTQKAVAVLRSFGSDAHVYMPGIGWMNGLTAGNWIDSAGTTPAVVDNPVGKVDDANGSIDATQATTANKPILRRGAVNLLTYSGDLSNAAWALTNTATKAGSTLNTQNTNDAVYNTTSVPSGTYTLAIEVSGSGTCSLWGYNATDFAVGVRQITLGERALFVSTFTTASAGTTLRLGRRSGDAATAINFHAGAIFRGTYTAAQIQALGGIPLTTTAPASTEQGNYFWEFDGGNDSLALGSSPLSLAADHFVIAAFSSSAVTGASQVIYGGTSSASAQTLIAQIYIDQADTKVKVAWRDATGTEIRILSGPVVTTGETVVATAARIAGVCYLWVNGVLQSSGAFVGASTVSDAATIGATIRVGALTLPLKGGCKYINPVQGTLTEPIRNRLEKYAASIAGVTI